jgi:outer membrane lipoprotein-sorting protein
MSRRAPALLARVSSLALSVGLAVVPAIPPIAAQPPTPKPAASGLTASAPAHSATIAFVVAAAPAHSATIASVAAAAPAPSASTAAPAAAPAPARSAATAPASTSTSIAPAPAHPSSTAAPISAAATADPWSVLQSVRRSLVEAGPVAANFSQVYIPAGFTEGETETGRLSLSLPDCLRWDYQNPYPKGFLLCGEVVHTWNSEDKVGRRYRVDRKNEPGLDLLLLGVDDLKGRYAAAGRAAGGGRVEVTLTPRNPAAGAGRPEELADARLVVDPATRRVVAISYHDREGNLTRFEIAAYEALPRQGQFSPPRDIRWEEP